jgi:hypothetical protein
LNTERGDEEEQLRATISSDIAYSARAPLAARLARRVPAVGSIGTVPLGDRYTLTRSTAQERVTGGRWRRIMLGDVLAEHGRVCSYR